MVKKIGNTGITINGFTVRESVGSYFLMENDTVIINLTAEGKDGGLYWKVNHVFNKLSQRRYTAQKYTLKYTSIVGGVAMQLAESGYLWDYVQQRPFLEAKIDAMRKMDKYRESQGKSPLYKEYLDNFDYSLIQ